MAQTILVTPETLRSQAAQIRSYTQEHEDIIQRMTNLVMTLDEVWTGNAQATFVNNFQGMKDTFDSFEEALLAYAQMMEGVAEKMESTDRALQSRIRSIS